MNGQLEILEGVLLVLFLLLVIVIAFVLVFQEDVLAILQGEVPNLPSAQEPRLSPDAQRYFELKNRSCDTLKGPFLIMVHDLSEGSINGLLNSTPGESILAEGILSDFHFNQTTKTYVKGDKMKRVAITEEGEVTTIWKDGRVYECKSNCTMRLMGSEESAAYYDSLYLMKTSCAYFGKTEMPSSVDMSKLLIIQRTGAIEKGGYSCDNFRISGNKTYLTSLPPSQFDEDQRALLWLLSNSVEPIEECLDESTGIVVSRNVKIDLTDSYRLNYSPGGYMHVIQQTELLYFTNNVPDSFFALPS